jgi:hypothetical protein
MSSARRGDKYSTQLARLMSNPQLLAEGLTNLEDLDVTAFIDAVRRIGQMQASEMLDGANLYFGLDESGTFYTTRSQKRESGDKYYASTDYPYFAANNGFRAAHEALQAKERDIKIAFLPGDLAEVDILYGRQPNAVSYGLDGKNFIAIIRGIEPTTDVKIDQLMNMLKNNEVVVKSIIVDTSDGINLERKTVNQVFRFVGAQKINPDALKSVKLEKELAKLEKYLNEKSGIGILTNYELMNTSLGSVDKEQRVEAKAVKERVIATVKNQHKLTIKKELLDKFVRKLKPALGAADLSGDEDLGVHGVILKDPNTGETLKVVDKAAFDTVNDFNYAVRNQIAGSIRSIDDAAPLEARGGITGQMKIRIADLLGNKDMAMGRNAKKIFADNMGDTPPATLRNVAKLLNGADFQGVKRKIEAVVSATIDELTNMLNRFNKHKDSTEDTYRLRLKNGKAIGLSPETIKRTNMTFAETRRNLQELKDKVNQAKSFDNLVAILYGRMAKQVHAEGGQSDSLGESFNGEIEAILTERLIETRNFTDTARYKAAADAQQLLQMYLATVLMAVIIFKAEDKQGEKLLRDKNNYRLTKYNDSMSALNFWGFAVWQSDNATVAKMLQPGVAVGLHKITKKVPPQWVKNLHMDLSYAGDMTINWAEHFKTIRYLLQHAEGMAGIERVVSMLGDVFNYENLTFDQKTKVLPKVYFYGTQYVPTSPLLTRVRFIQNNLLGSGYDPLDDVSPTVQLAPGAAVNKLLGEDGEIATGPDAGYNQTAPSGTDARATVAAVIAPKDTRLGNTTRMTDGKRKIVKRKRNPDIKFKKFERPDPEEQHDTA